MPFIKVEVEYLVFIDDTPPDRKTKIIQIRGKQNGYLLGHIKWYGAWRQYVFYPEEKTLFNKGCLTDIQQKMDELMAERKEEKVKL